MKKICILGLFIIILSGCSKVEPVYSISIMANYSDINISGEVVKNSDDSYLFLISEPSYLSSAEITLSENIFTISVYGFNYTDTNTETLNKFAPFITLALDAITSGDFDSLDIPNISASYEDAVIIKTNTEAGAIITVNIPTIDFSLDIIATEI